MEEIVLIEHHFPFDRWVEERGYTPMKLIYKRTDVAQGNNIHYLRGWPGTNPLHLFLPAACSHVRPTGCISDIVLRKSSYHG